MRMAWNHDLAVYLCLMHQTCLYHKRGCRLLEFHKAIPNVSSRFLLIQANKHHQWLSLLSLKFVLQFSASFCQFSWSALMIVDNDMIMIDNGMCHHHCLWYTTIKPSLTSFMSNSICRSCHVPEMVIEIIHDVIFRFGAPTYKLMWSCNVFQSEIWTWSTWIEHWHGNKNLYAV